MKDLAIRLFIESDAEAVQNIIHRGLREINGKDYPAELIEEYCAYFSLEKIKSQAASAHMYVAVSGDKIVGTGSIAPYWGSEKESILLTVYVLPEMIGQGIGTAIINTLEQDEYFLRANRIEIPSSITAVKFYQKMGYGVKNGSIPDEECLIRMEKFRNVKLLSEMTLEELWQLFPIILSPHNPEWKNFYKTEADLLQKHFGKNAARIRHIGSTAVAGLLAKPTVDILLEMADVQMKNFLRKTQRSITFAQIKLIFRNSCFCHDRITTFDRQLPDCCKINIVCCFQQYINRRFCKQSGYCSAADMADSCRIFTEMLLQQIGFCFIKVTNIA